MNRVMLSAFREELEKIAEIHLLSGGTGAGKSTEARRRAKHYDHVFTTDIGEVVNGKYTFPPDKKKARAEKEAKILALHRQGKKILVEGYNNGVSKYPGLVANASKMEVMGTSTPVRLFRVLKRHVEQGRKILDFSRFPPIVPLSDTGWRPVKEDREALQRIRRINPSLPITTAKKTKD